MTSAAATCMSTSHCDQQLAVTMAPLWGTIHCNVMCFNVIFLLVQDLKPLPVSNFSLSSLYSSLSFLISYIVPVLELTISACTEGTDLEEVATDCDVCSAD